MNKSFPIKTIFANQEVAGLTLIESTWSYFSSTPVSFTEKHHLSIFTYFPLGTTKVSLTKLQPTL